MKYLPPNTLAYFKAAPQVHRHDLSWMPSSVFAAATKEYRKTCGVVLPDTEAQLFYALNHCASIVRKSFTPNEPLPEWARKIMEQYTTVMASQGNRMLHYILSITTRELRHLGIKTDKFWKEMTKIAGPEMAAFVKANQSHNEDAAVNHYMTHPPTATIGQYISAMAYGFWKGWGDYSPQNMDSWSGSYGGPTWAMVAEAAKSMLEGKISMEMLVDTGYTLAHNGGPIFNKDMMYQHYSVSFMTLLDVQRVGQIPNLLLSTQQQHGISKVSDAVAAVKIVAQEYPEEFQDWVDWKLVNEMRPLKDKMANPHKYDKWIAEQVKAQPVAAKPKPVEKFIGGKKVKVTGTWNVFPGQAVTVYERVA